jgi:membrane protease YdiL (CAAX protease family)
MSVESDIQPFLSVQPRRGVWIEIAAVVAMAVIPDLYSAVVFYGMGIDSEYGGEAVLHVGLLVRSLAVCLPLWVIIRLSGVPLHEYGLRAFRQNRDVLWGLVLLGAAYAAMNVLWFLLDFSGFADWVSSYTWFPDPQERNSVGLFLLMLLAMLTNGFAEEFVMRGYLLNRLRHVGIPAGWGVAITSVLFASYHIWQGTHGLVHACAFGVVMGVAVVRLKRLWPAVVAHAFWDIIVVSIASVEQG